MSSPGLSAEQFWLLVICLIGGVILTIIGVRFLTVPESAAFTFGIGTALGDRSLHYVIGLRDIWLGLLAIAFAVLRQWLALGLWFGLCTLVCFADAAIAASSSGGAAQVAFHASSGLISLALTVAILRVIRREC